MKKQELDPIIKLLRRRPGMTAMQICKELGEMYNQVMYRLYWLERREFIEKNIDDQKRKRWNRWYAK